MMGVVGMSESRHARKHRQLEAVMFSECSDAEKEINHRKMLRLWKKMSVKEREEAAVRMVMATDERRKKEGEGGGSPF